MRHNFFLLRFAVLSAGFVSLVACGDADPPSELVECADPAHEGLLCAIDLPPYVGECTQGDCVALPCRSTSDCYDYSGDSCRIPECTASGQCVTTYAPDGDLCGSPAGTGQCISGTCS
jgi:hypothetical protein